MERKHFSGKPEKRREPNRSMEEGFSGNENHKPSDRIIFASFDFFSFYLVVITGFS